MILLSISIFWLSVCVDPISADPHITVEAHVGSTALLPCTLSKVFSKTPHVLWHTDNKVVFERNIDGTYVGRGYEGRVDVPEDELRKGNCSLLLKDVRITDHAFYRSFELAEMKYYRKATEINTVKLDVEECWKISGRVVQSEEATLCSLGRFLINALGGSMKCRSKSGRFEDRLDCS
ncbi:hypothetical protein C0J45_9896 [Silurus meridionalis]|nr:hypothetical protein C0J45_9896 [Silurus meridionalis]